MTLSSFSLVLHTIAETTHTAAATTTDATHTAVAEKSDVLATLGIDWKLLVFQVIAFSILVALLSKFVFPVLIRAIDDRQAAIEESLLAAKNAEKNAADAEAKIDKLMRDARKEASEIVTTAKDEAAALATKTEERSKKQAERIVEEARESIGKEVLAAKKALHNETIELVAQATEKVVGAGMSKDIDKKIIAQSVSSAKDAK